MSNPISVGPDERPRSGRGGPKESGFFGALEQNLKERVEFFRVFIKEPARVGALGPSSPALARSMVHGLALKTADTVIEIGPGTGAFTGLILKQIGDATTFIALELNDQYVQSLKRRFPDLTVYNDSAERIGDYLTLHRKRSVKYIISGLPWAVFEPALQQRIMDAVLTSLAPGGVFRTFAYIHALWMPSARKYRSRLEKCFARVETSPVVWKNVPPAFVYHCSRPRRKAHDA